MRGRKHEKCILQTVCEYEHGIKIGTVKERTRDPRQIARAFINCRPAWRWTLRHLLEKTGTVTARLP